MMAWGSSPGGGGSRGGGGDRGRGGRGGGFRGGGRGGFGGGGRGFVDEGPPDTVIGEHHALAEILPGIFRLCVVILRFGEYL